MEQFNEIRQMLVTLSQDPFDPVLSFNIALEYEKIGQTASAVSFYLRTAEYGYYTHPEHVYASLLKSAQCFEHQTNRQSTVHNLFLKAVAFDPTRPEAWFLLARFCEREQRWQEGFTFAEVGLSVVRPRVPALPVYVDYPGEYALIFEKAVTGWWVGRKDDSIAIFKDLLKKEDIHHVYLTAVKNNLATIDGSTETVNPLETVVTQYRKYFGSHAPVIIDVGTRDGDDAYYLYRQLNGSKVIALDASKQCADMTRSKYPWMTVHQTAVSSTNGSVIFHQVVSNNIEVLGTSSVFSKETSIDPPPEFYADKTVAITVGSVRMDYLLSGTDVTGTIDVVKVDTEGFTWQVLQGFGDRLKDVKLFHLETERTSAHSEHRLSDEVKTFMEEQGFILVDTSHEWGWNVQDQIWVNPTLAVQNKECFL
jgi:FkbM family methyltransferase